MTEHDTPLGVAIVGVGGIAVSHMAALHAMTSAELVAVCDLDAARASEVAHVQRCAGYGSVEELLADDAVEAVIVCTPNMTHEQLGLQVLRAGKHLLMEKPLALTSEGARTVADEAASHGLALAVGHSHRFTDQSLAIREIIDAGEIGTPRFVRVVMNGGWIWPGWQSWVLDPEQSGGHSLHNGVHLVDLASWWIGEPATSVYSVGQHATSEALEIHDYLVMGLGFASGASAVCEISRGERPRSAGYLELTVAGTEGVISRTWDAEGVLAWTDTGLTAWGVDGAGGRAFVRELEAFVAAARSRAEVIPPPAAAVHAVDIAVASEESLRAGRTIRIGAPA
ncbi:MAG TPA: Gfo/Idh/MocA family oxidoreductase [Candidatus Ruania gallistercoris]|uniref:Gfo/Idh/MocA family oxidoreductase n=1 Tax=Candidatus Ruania gallistercoris TaxID=2838746 RepID=A0A9D2EHZ6_9MICO|nr:Gfo/Idh/MocA family oxidoreductase [Candidatus Ruania gallistercoris]